MILYLRNKNNNSLFEVEIYTVENGVEVHASTYIKNYSKFLLNNLDKKEYIINTFNDLDELRGWYYEHYLNQINSNPTEEEVVKVIEEILKEVAISLSLKLVED